VKTFRPDKATFEAAGTFYNTREPIDLRSRIDIRLDRQKQIWPFENGRPPMRSPSGAVAKEVGTHDQLLNVRHFIENAKRT
jgi:hypothetical protein